MFLLGTACTVPTRGTYPPSNGHLMTLSTSGFKHIKADSRSQVVWVNDFEMKLIKTAFIHFIVQANHNSCRLSAS